MNTKILFLSLLAAALFFSCEKESVLALDDPAVVYSDNTKGDFSTNVSIFDVRARTVDENHYAQEMYLVSFGDYEIVEDGFIFSDMLYKDDGQELDVIAGDGLYTAVALKKFSKNVHFIESVDLQSLLEEPIVTKNFLYEVELKDMLETYPLHSFDGAKDITIRCSVGLSECPNENWWDTSWFGEPCLEIKNCTISF